MMNKLTEAQLQEIRYIMKTGEYYHHKTQEINIQVEKLYEAFCLYCRYRGIKRTSFKTRYFRPIMRTNTSHTGGFHHDIPLSVNQVMKAIRYGIDQGDITVVRGPVNPIKVSHIVRVYRFNHELKEGMQHEFRDNELRDLR